MVLKYRSLYVHKCTCCFLENSPTHVRCTFSHLHVLTSSSPRSCQFSHMFINIESISFFWLYGSHISLIVHSFSTKCDVGCHFRSALDSPIINVPNGYLRPLFLIQYYLKLYFCPSTVGVGSDLACADTQMSVGSTKYEFLWTTCTRGWILNCSASSSLPVFFPISAFTRKDQLFFINSYETVARYNKHFYSDWFIHTFYITTKFKKLYFCEVLADWSKFAITY